MLFRSSVFDLSYSKLFTGDMGYLYPVMHDEVMPGDKFKIANQMVIRMMPLVSPVLHEIDAYVHYFFVPYRLLDENWEEFITGGVDGGDTSSLPTWNPTGANGVGTLWDYMGMPVGIVPTGTLPLDYPKLAYNLIWNEYYMDPTLQTEVDITTSQVLLLRNWEKDYFTSCLPWQQRGTAPALPIAGTTSAVWQASTFPNPLS